MWSGYEAATYMYVNLLYRCCKCKCNHEHTSLGLSSFGTVSAGMFIYFLNFFSVSIHYFKHCFRLYDTNMACYIVKYSKVQENCNLWKNTFWKRFICYYVQQMYCNKHFNYHHNLFLQGVSMKQLIKAFDWVKDEVVFRERDLGFSGDTCAVISHATSVFGDGLVSLTIRELVLLCWEKWGNHISYLKGVNIKCWTINLVK